MQQSEETTPRYREQIDLRIPSRLKVRLEAEAHRLDLSVQKYLLFLLEDTLPLAPNEERRQWNPW